MAKRELQFGDLLELTDEGEERIGHLWRTSPRRAVFLKPSIYGTQGQIWIVMEGSSSSAIHQREWYRPVRTVKDADKFEAAKPFLIDLLYQTMSDISEEQWCAGWCIGTEYELWRAVHHDERQWGMGEISQESIDKLRAISDLVGGWHDMDRFYTFAEWTEHLQSTPKENS